MILATKNTGEPAPARDALIGEKLDPSDSWR